MLLQFVVENFLSFRDRVALSFLAADSVEHTDGQTLDGPDGLKVLRCVALYGANASGKSNLVRALKFVQELVLQGTRPEAGTGAAPFKLEPAYAERPAHFEIELAVNGARYSYGFEITSARVEAEWLHVSNGSEERMLFERAAEPSSFDLGELGVTEERKQFLRFVAEGTRVNQLFVAEASDRNVSELEDLLLALRRLSILLPGDTGAALVEEAYRDDALREFANSLVADSGTGISALEVVSEESPELVSESFRRTLNRVGVLPSGAEVAIAVGPGGKIFYHSLSLLHTAKNGPPVRFGAREESDGTRRLLTLAPVLYRLHRDADGIAVIDEIDRSLHPELTRRFLERFFDENTGQLIFTTHDPNLLDARLLPRDSIWFVEKDHGGASRLYPLTEFDPAQLTKLEGHLEDGYLQGRFGAIPFFGDPTKLGWVRKAT